MRLRARIAAVALLASLGATITVFATDAPAIAGQPATSRGESIYLKGTLSSGALLQGSRQGGQNLQGAAAACVRCHRNSGLGMQEAGYLIPPISAPYLFHAGSAASGAVDLPYVPGQHLDHPPYTEATLARAIREGVNSEGKPLGFLMPRFALDDADMADLIGYLKSFAPLNVPGVTPTLLHFATIVTPDADPVKRRGMLDVLAHYFAEKNSFPFPPSPRMHTSGKADASKSMYMANRRWQLHVWQLEGPADTWAAQLDQDLAREPVMAVISGLGGADWSPIHRFCERAHLPCLFPNAEVPVLADQDFYTLYFSKGVLLEAQLIARRLGAHAGAAPPATVQQIYRSGDSGEVAAELLAKSLQDAGWATRQAALGADDDPQAVRMAVQAALAKGPLVLWLRPRDLAALADLPAPQQPLFVSGLMGGLDATPLPAAWRGHALLSYPVDLPDRRVVRLDYPLGWFNIRHIPVVAQQVQVDTYLACGLLSETLSHMADNFVREYLVERMEEMLGHRILTGYYPRLSLAAGQRFASKGGYLVQLTTAEGKVVADGDWTVP